VPSRCGRRRAWIPAIAARGLLVIARDKKLQTKPVEIQALWDHGARVFSIGGKDRATWERLAHAVRHRPGTESSSPSSGTDRGSTCSMTAASTSSSPNGQPDKVNRGPARSDAELHWPLPPIFRLLEKIGRNYRNRHEIVDGLDGIQILVPCRHAALG
jgi:PIN like domain